MANTVADLRKPDSPVGESGTIERYGQTNQDAMSFRLGFTYIGNQISSPSLDTIMKLNMLLAIGLCTALTTGALAQDDKAVKEARKAETRRDVKKVGNKVENGVADGAHAVGTAGRAVGKAGKATGQAVANGAKATGRAVTKATKATGRAISGEAKKVEN